jgi:ATP-dependent Clp protease ATP-binding subunit ClpB
MKMVAQFGQFAATVLNHFAVPASNKDQEEFKVLDHKTKSEEAHAFEHELSARVVGQERALRALSQIYQVYQAGLNTPGRPIGTLLFLGPTGTGKTRSVEAAAEVLFGSPSAFVRIDCAEFQHPHEISKLIGAPPGYLGHRETPPMLSQENLDSYHTERTKLSLVLFDEIEKASDALWQLLLGVLDKATLTLGDNRRVDFSRSIVVMTSNLGAREMDRLTEEPLGFACMNHQPVAALDSQFHRVGLEAARKRFSPEFMNRLDSIVVFHRLTDDSMRQILELELQAVQQRILTLNHGRFIMRYTDTAKAFLLARGTSARYGARELKRTIERYVVLPLSNLVATRQIRDGDVLLTDMGNEEDSLVFMRRQTTAVSPEFDPCDFGFDRMGRAQAFAGAAR